MKYTVKITQRLKYDETLIGTFNEMMEIFAFIDLIIHHFDHVVKIEIEVSNDKEVTE